MNDTILSVQNLSVSFSTPEGDVKAVNDLSFDLRAGQSLAVVGESGSGKSQSFLSMMGLLAKNGKAEGKVMFEGKNLVELNHKQLDNIRGDDIAMIFQDPMTSLNPSLTIEKQLTEVLIRHKNMSRKQAYEHSVNMLDKVGIPEAYKRIKSYPHQLSGGMRQRVMIAMALLCDPKILIADEPTTALDVTIQAQILDLFSELKNEFNTALILITHDLGVVAGLCDEMMVLYGGRVMEKGSVEDIFESPAHPYSLGLLHSTPNMDEDSDLQAIAGSPPNLQNLPKGCAFAPRCPFKGEECLSAVPPLIEREDGRKHACLRTDIQKHMAHEFAKMEGI